MAVIDTGVAWPPRLPRLKAGGDYVFTGDGTQDCDGHGTAVAGIIGAAPNSTHIDDFSGVAPRCRTHQHPTVEHDVRRGLGSDELRVRRRKHHGTRRPKPRPTFGATVINISSVACARDHSALDDRPLGAALAYAVDTKNAVVVAAAGNGGTGQCPAQQGEPTVIVSPAWYDDFVLTVGSVSTGEPSSFTLAGPWVDVAAPGEGVISLSSSGAGLTNAFAAQGSSTSLSGTSYAAPVVSGLAALIRSRFPTWTARQVMQRIRATAHHPPGG